jgi:sugar phosphate isomerase/epimerase
MELLRAFPGRLGCVFDPANFIQVGAKPFPDAYMALEKHVTYVHIKDCAASGTIVLPGYGVGGIPEMFAYLNRTVCGEIVVTMEPHLKTFAGLSALEGNEKTKISDNVFATNEEAFTAAADSMKMCMPKTAVVR